MPNFFGVILGWVISAFGLFWYCSWVFGLWVASRLVGGALWVKEMGLSLQFVWCWSSYFCFFQGLFVGLWLECCLKGCPGGPLCSLSAPWQYRSILRVRGFPCHWCYAFAAVSLVVVSVVDAVKPRSGEQHSGGGRWAARALSGGWRSDWVCCHRLIFAPNVDHQSQSSRRFWLFYWRWSLVGASFCSSLAWKILLIFSLDVQYVELCVSCGLADLRCFEINASPLLIHR